MTVLTIRNADRGELDIIIDWAAREGWNPGVEDAPAFWAADPDGYYVAEVDGRLAAAISLIRYGMKPVFETARMYRGTTSALPLDRLDGITTFELG
ncbi:hypothetical protein ATN84_10500 [Paramesorhizobium deserti]|uniref:Acetyltransferase n=1 Tax=Paramesorhizobium deserti TaxID=1494590 RepID=A0A135HX28_9HYPH|nr:hypothetical protein ATN84_10500 [Paramesorhizobium deserti]